MSSNQGPHEPQEPQSVQIPDVINAITNHCMSHHLDELKTLCLNLFNAPNDTKQAEHVISDGLIRYIKNYYDVVKFLLDELKNNAPNHLAPVFQQLIKYASNSNDLALTSFLLNSQKPLLIENSTVLEAICMTENILFIRDVIVSLHRLGFNDITIGLQSAITSKLDVTIVFLLKMNDDLRLSFNYERCLQTAINTNAYGIITLLLDRVKDLSNETVHNLLVGPRNTGNVMMVDFFLQKCKDKNIIFKSEATGLPPQIV